MSPRPTVWVVKEQVKTGQHGSAPMDYTAAYQFGDVKFITDFDLPLHSNSSLGNRWFETVEGFLGKFERSRDFIILTGSPLAIFVTGLIMGKAQLRPIQILVWRREQGRYVLTTI